MEAKSVEMKLEDREIDFFVVKQVFDGMVGMEKEHIHNYYEVFYVSKGERVFYQNGIPYKLSSNQLVIIPPGYSHLTISLKPAKQVLYFLGFPDDFFDEFIPGVDTRELFSFGEIIVDINENESEYITHVFDILETISEDNNHLRVIKLKSAIFDLIFNHTKYDKKTDIDIYVSPGKLSSQVKYMMMSSYIKKNFNQKITLDTLANKFDVSKCEISRNFKKYVGASFVEYINTIRVAEAQSLISCTNSSFVDIAISVGFESLSRFGKVFKQISSMTPSEYKKQIKPTKKN
ncbi:MAG: helix-turn-helix transcriptional regulator [Clostridia bacterium]|nr:helix-turn-helix transcriptional regulator [Clostridia bacterium]